MPKKNLKKQKPRKDKKKLILLGVFFLVIFSVVLFDEAYDFTSRFEVGGIRHYIDAAGFWGPILFMVVMAIAIVISPIPSLPLAAAAGVVWGPFLATIYSVIGAEIGAVFAFLIARKLGRGFVMKIFKKNVIVCLNCKETYLFYLVLVARLFPFFQFDIISYGAGLTNMRLKNFALATLIGMVPMTFLFTTLGESVVIGSSFALIATVLVIIGFFVVPIAIEKHNFLGLRGKIIIK